MPPPATPVLTVTPQSPTSFVASITGGTAGVAYTLYYQRIGSDNQVSVATITGNGNFPPVSNIPTYSHLIVWCIGYDGASYSFPVITKTALIVPDYLSTAIHDYFNGSASLVAAVPGGLWTGEVPEGVSFPYIYLDFKQVNTVYNFVSRGEYARIAFHLYALGAESAEATGTLLKSRFDGQKLTFSLASQTNHIVMIPQRHALVSENLRHKSGQLVFRFFVEYQILLQKPR